MARSLNKVMLIGNLGRDAEMKYTPSGVPVSRFSVATTRRWKDQQTGEWKDDTTWTNVVLWRNENLAPYLTKGKQVYVEGRIETRSYEDKDGQKKYATEVVADEVMLLGGRGDGGSGGGAGGGDDWGAPAPPVSMPRSASRGAGGSSSRSMPQEDTFGGGSDDDVPF
jgi:single-strand DNA-binding protein